MGRFWGFNDLFASYFSETFFTLFSSLPLWWFSTHFLRIFPHSRLLRFALNTHLVRLRRFFSFLAFVTCYIYKTLFAVAAADHKTLKHKMKKLFLVVCPREKLLMDRTHNLNNNNSISPGRVSRGMAHVTLATLFAMTRLFERSLVTEFDNIFCEIWLSMQKKSPVNKFCYQLTMLKPATMNQPWRHSDNPFERFWSLIGSMQLSEFASFATLHRQMKTKIFFYTFPFFQTFLAFFITISPTHLHFDAPANAQKHK